MNVSTLTVLLVCIIAEYAHAAPYQWGWENFQPRSKRSSKNELSVVEDWKSVCKEVCGAGYGGPGCGGHCFTYHYGQSSLLTKNEFQEICPILCKNKLGVSKCNCLVVDADGISVEKDHDLLCSATCKFRSFRLNGCTKCITQLEIATEGKEELTNEDTTTEATTTISTTESTTTSTTSTTTLPSTTTVTTTQATTTTPDWPQLCEILCRNGEGGSLCNCDIPPFF